MRSLLVLLFGCVACVTAAPAPTGPVTSNGPRARELFPLAIGNRWTYDVSFAGAKQTLSVSIVSAEGSTFQDSRGWKFIAEPDGLRDEHRYLLKEPISVGSHWSSIIDVATTEDYRVAEVGIGLDVRAGHFDACVRITSRSPQTPGVALLAEQIYCPGVGLAKVMTYQEKQGNRGPAQWSQELASYHVTVQ